MKPISIKILNKHAEKIKEIFAYEKIVEKRIDYIVKELGNIFGIKNIEWRYTNGYNGDRGDFITSQDGNSIFIEFSPALYDNPILTKDGKELFFDEYIPYRWLCEDFEDEVKNGIKSYKKMREDEIKREKEEKEKKKEKNEKTLNKIREVLLDNLTKDEIEFLNKKFDIGIKL